MTLPLHYADDCRLRKKILKPGPPEAPRPNWGQEVTVKLQGVLEDRSVVEKDRKLVFVVGEADVIQVPFPLTLTHVAQL